MGASGAGAASAVVAAAGSAAPSGAAPTFRSAVVAGSTSTFWFGTATGFATWPCPPAATAAAADAVVALLSSSSQSISSSPPVATRQYDATRVSAQMTARRTSWLLVMLLQPCNEVRFIARDGESALREELLQVRDFELCVVRHGGSSSASEYPGHLVGGDNYPVKGGQ